MKQLEGEMQLKRRTLEQTKSREQRLNQEIQEVRDVCVCVHLCVLISHMPIRQDTSLTGVSLYEF